MPPLLRALRPGQWTKNLFVLAPILFGKAAGDPERLTATLLTFACFCAIASALYLVNDVADREADALHPVKSRRPIASGALSVNTALATSVVLLAAAMTALALRAPAALPYAAAYAVVVALYTFVLKKVALLDVFVVASGFVLRVLAGSAAAAVTPSHWLLLCTFFLALFLALSKRRGELLGSGVASRKSLDGLTVNLVESLENVATAVTIVSYALYTVAPETMSWFGSDRLLYTVPFVVFGLFRWRVLEVRGAGEDTTNDLFTDRGLLATVVVWAATCAGLIYFVR